MDSDERKSEDAETDAPSDLEEDEEKEVDASTAVSVAEGLLQGGGKGPVPEEGLVRHSRYLTIHKKGDGTFTRACGLRLLPEDYEGLDQWPAVAWPLCGRAKCFK